MQKKKKQRDSESAATALTQLLRCPCTQPPLYWQLYLGKEGRSGLNMASKSFWADYLGNLMSEANPKMCFLSSFLFFLWPWRPWISCDATFPLGCFFQHMGLCALGLATFLTMQAIKFLSPLLLGTDYYSTFSSPFKRMLKLLAVSIGRVSAVGSPAVLQIH